MIDLMKVREALALAAREDGAIEGCLCTRCDCANALAALDSHLALSEYDRCLDMLAPYLNVGFVAQDKNGETSAFGSNPLRRANRFSTALLGGGGYGRTIPLKIPRHPDWQQSPRRIVSTPTGNRVERPQPPAGGGA